VFVLNVTSPPTNPLYEAFLGQSPQSRDYLRQWTYDTPLAIRPETHELMRRAQHLYLKCMRHAAEHYLDRYRHLMPVPERVEEILALCRRRPYRPGTYRTDFVVGLDNRFRLVETTCRFALNGFFRAGVYEQIAREHLLDHPGIRSPDLHTPFFQALLDYFGSFERVCVLQGWNTPKNESKFFIPIFEAAGWPVEKIPAGQVAKSAHLFEKAAVIGELSHEELCALPDETLEALIDSNHLNDLRTVFLVHDKRFFALFQQEEFARNALSPGERGEFSHFLPRTCTLHLNPEIWPEARANKDKWILKPANNGMSIDVFAGPVTPQAEWQALFDSGRADNMVLQEYIPQRKFRGTVAGVPHEDFAAGTLLYFEEEFYGTGFLRASSHPVTNKVDDRKIPTLITPDIEQFEVNNVL
jgi:hypothetical protein